LIFTNPDGTPLDHDGYSFESAKPALEFLRLQQVPALQKQGRRVGCYFGLIAE
jgi:hypothetical protein